MPGESEGKCVKSILEYLERTTERFGERNAVQCEDITWSYAELTDHAKRIGSALSSYIKPGEAVAVFSEKSPLMLSAMFGTAYAGGFYVPVNPEQPAARIRTMLATLEPRVLIVADELAKRAVEFKNSVSILSLESLAQSPVNEDLLASVRESVNEDDLLYGIFTSGSTGTPKCVTVSHRSVRDFISHFTNIFEITDQDVLANQAPFDFDVSVKDIYSCMMTGATLLLIPREYFVMPGRLVTYLQSHGVTVMIWAVSALLLLLALRAIKKPEDLPVKKILFSGEVMPVSQMKKWKELLPKTEFVNLYGPTEITCNCTYHVIEEEDLKKDALPAGQAFPGRWVFLRDADGNEIVKTGMSGEITVAGESIADGYYHNPEMTARVFYIDAKYGRCYRTGDEGYKDEKGVLYFRGREDFQIKHMGHRIELEEIENAMSEEDAVSRGCCVYDGEKMKIIGFYTGEITPPKLRKALKVRLPLYMIPQKLEKLESFPLTKNGKLDRQELKKLAENPRGAKDE